MAMLEWNDSLSCHVAVVDTQHKKLVDMVNTLYDSMKGESTDAALLNIVDEMTKYTVYHFNTEEELMDQYDDPETEAHKNEHKDFIDKVAKVEADLKNGSAVLSMDILNFLSGWLVTHINDTDKKMGTYLASKGAS